MGELRGRSAREPELVAGNGRVPGLWRRTRSPRVARESSGHSKPSERLRSELIEITNGVFVNAHSSFYSFNDKFALRSDIELQLEADL